MMTFPYKLVDLTHTLTPTTRNWDGECGFSHHLNHDHDPTAEYSFRTFTIDMDAGIGTHMDAPAHCFPNGKSIVDLDINDFLAPCVVIDVSAKSHERYSISPQDIKDFESQYGSIPQGSFVIVYTGWSRFWSDPDQYLNNHIFPDISLSAAELLLQRDIVGVGIDTLSPDRPENGFPVHKAILGAGKYIVENIANADGLPNVGGYSLALPLKIQDGTEAPLRLIGLVNIGVVNI